MRRTAPTLPPCPTEHASEMIIKAALLGMPVVEVPVTLDKDGRVSPTGEPARKLKKSAHGSVFGETWRAFAPF